MVTKIKTAQNAEQEKPPPTPATRPPAPDCDVKELAILPVKDVVLFPGMIVPLIIAESDSIKLIDDVLSGEKIFGHVTMRPSDKTNEKPPPVEALPQGKGDDTEEFGIAGQAGSHLLKPHDLFGVGVSAEILKMLKFPDGTVRILAQGTQRVAIEGFTLREPYIKARVRPLYDRIDASTEFEALLRNVTATFIKMVKLVPYLPDELQIAVMNITDPSRLSFLIASNMNIPIEEKQKLLDTDSVRDRLERLLVLLNHEIAILELGSKIESQVQEEIGKNQRQHILREQMRAIQRELGETDERTTEVNELREKIKQARMPADVEKVASEELDRMWRIAPGSAEYTVSRTYIDWLIALPWRASTEDNLDITRARQILDEDHYDLDKVKQRILEYLSVRKLKNDMKGPILCFVGPPGVGKTSLGRSIARALGRKFIRMSVGGMRDEAEIRGHRRTYIGSLPGRMLQSLRKAGSNNPVFMIDEIDKIGADFRGDPSAALLEVLDPEQNFSFADHYLEVPFDLSKVMFITTANVGETIIPALRDRMETLELPGYSEEEKINIARKHVIPKQLAEHGLTAKRLEFDIKAIETIISDYTREAGLRNLEREVANVCRKIARCIAEGTKCPRKITKRNVVELLGPERYYSEVAERSAEPGVATGLAWTPTGGDILHIEATMMKGSKSLMLTGQLGEVMKESAQAALSYIRSHAAALGIKEETFRDYDIHIHVPAGGIPKDGPSAGVAMATTLVSLFTGRAVKPTVAMTGEITLRGKVLPVGGIKEKVLAARRAGMKQVIMPRRNEKDLLELPANIRKTIKFTFVDKLDDALKVALEKRHK
jgi:ATP-dependent Lon protease